jgi:hypothetical protein
MAAITLKGGLIVQEEAIALAIELENAGVTLTAKEGVLVASPASALTPTQIAAIRAMKFQLLAIAAVDYPLEDVG